MAEQKSECLIDNNNKSGGGGGIPTEPMKRAKFDFSREEYEEMFRIRRIIEREKRKRKSHDNKEEEEESEEYKAYTAHMTECLVKPRLGHQAWLRYRDYLATQKAAATPVYHDEALGPKKKLMVNEAEDVVEGGDHETSTKKEKKNR